MISNNSNNNDNAMSVCRAKCHMALLYCEAAAQAGSERMIWYLLAK